MNETMTMDYTPYTWTVPTNPWFTDLIENLVLALKRDRPDEKVMAAVIDLMHQDFSLNYIVHKVHESLGQEASGRLKQIVNKS